MRTNECIPVACEWQGDGFTLTNAKCCRLRVTDPGPLFTYQQHGHTLVSREPLAAVEFHANDGLQRGAARLSDLRAAGVVIARRVRVMAHEALSSPQAGIT